MNLVCAYCGVKLVDGNVAARLYSELLRWGKWCLLAAALLLPIVGLAIGLAHASDENDARRSIGKLWLIAGLCSSLTYLVMLTR